MKRDNDNFRRDLNKETFNKVLKDCCDKMEGLNDLDWQDIIDKYDLGIHRDVLRKAFSSPLGGYAVYREMKEKELNYSKSSNLDMIINEIGELEAKKQIVRNETSQLKKFKKDFIKAKQISDDISQQIIDSMKDVIQDCSDYERYNSYNDNMMIICVSDWHIGYVINNFKDNNYNYDIAKERLEKLLEEVKKEIDRYNITEATIVNCGDIIENAYMRENQSYECEFNLSEQIAKAIRLFWWFISKISEWCNVNVITVGGNHSRATTLKTANIEGDNSNIIIKDQLELLTEVSNNKRITISDIDYIDDSGVFEWCNKKYKVLHGDNRMTDRKKLYDSECSMDNCRYEAIIMGHYHNFNVVSQNNGAKVITCGCLFGYNPYSVKKMGATTNASQEILILNEDGVDIIKDVNLQ